MRWTLAAVVVVGCLSLVACGSGSDEAATPSITPGSASATPTPQFAQGYPGAIVGTFRTVNGATYVSEIATGLDYFVSGVTSTAEFSKVLFVIGTVQSSHGVYRVQVAAVRSVKEIGSTSCDGTLVRRDGRYFVEGPAAESGCGSIELIEVDPQKLEPQVGQEIDLTVRYCTITREGRMVKADLNPDFVCSGPYP